MPWQQRDIIQFCLILLCLPLQYYLSGFFEGVKDSDRSQIVMSIMKSIDNIKEKLFNIDLWTLKWHDLVLWAFSVEHTSADGDGNEDIKESMSHRSEHEGSSKINSQSEYQEEYNLLTSMSKIKNKRPDGLLYRIGQTVQLIDNTFTGIIIGWDYDDEMIDQPVYTVLLDESNVEPEILSVIIQVSQDKLYLVKNFEVTHRYLSRYFLVQMTDNAQYIPRNWLRKLYPKD